MLVKGAEGTCLPLTSARGCATPGCTNFLTGAFPARGEKAVYGPRAASGGAPTRHMPAPPARAEQGARGGRGRSAPTRARSDSGAAPSPRAAPALFAGASRGGLVPGRGARRPPSGRPFNAAHTLNGGSGGSPHVGRPSPSDEAPGRRARGHEERVTKTNSARTAASERAAQGARAPPPRRCPAYAGRGCSEGSCCSIRCAAAWRPVVHALPRILPPDYSWVRSSAWEMMLHAASQPCT